MKTQQHYLIWFCICCRQQEFYKDVKTNNHHNSKAIWKDVLLSHPLLRHDSVVTSFPRESTCFITQTFFDTIS